MRLIRDNNRLQYNFIKIEKCLGYYNIDICYYSDRCTIGIACEYYPPFSNSCYYVQTHDYYLRYYNRYKVLSIEYI